ncbi:MAG: pantoate--beta-alanine ligase [Omnitrophica WOR_2 bacterium RIFCSPLOWO2_12_FULL_51_24]|nr:MAG: pantoate--beta-alanine ligase [Omnitrophica WOR_2 bacterium RIFCSPHIGHO2_01_FULL_49_10]OGX33900.1 MAG: pantoate--beta-alanine ligase [Omnitrophica WOR_2 bacterium RIFCSPLOWO2_02_FULL_50_19]OGX43813.1 MAG: pantoate--beta-alanine ligase [Omnitrophica WOR_2 bacterium RIFCSPLOWO2_12_FULL_51_24]
MKIIRSISKIKKELSRKKRKGLTIGLIPTMGYLHEGHASLVKRARQDNDLVVVSIFVNPAQFGPNEDYMEYPRNLREDAVLCKNEGVDYIFCPSVKAMYPKGYSTYVKVKGLTENLCGKFRPTHFRGVTTVVVKLFNIADPDIAYFGHKDAQQAIVIKRMAEDLNMDVRIKVMPTVRERDGLAMSSRNGYLSSDERRVAPTVYRALQLARDLIRLGDRDAANIRSEMRKMLSPVVSKIDYISIVDPKDLKEIKTIKGGVLVAVAVWIGETRLIDNIEVKA